MARAIFSSIVSASFALMALPGVAGALELGAPDVWGSRVPIVLGNGETVDTTLGVILIKGEVWDGGNVETKISNSGGDGALIESVATFEEGMANFSNSVKVEDGKITALATWEAPQQPGKVLRSLVVRPPEGAEIVIEPIEPLDTVAPIRLGQPPYPIVKCSGFRITGLAEAPLEVKFAGPRAFSIMDIVEENNNRTELRIDLVDEGEVLGNGSEAIRIEAVE